jgi:hypothetical protein
MTRSSALNQVPGALLIALWLLLLFAAPAAGDEPPPAAAPTVAGTHVLLGWNDLGMHCSNKYFQDLAVLPPFNTLYAQVIRRGNSNELPMVLGPGYRLTYEFIDNTYSVVKTDFWSYEDLLFGTSLPDNVGLTGKGMTGTLDWTTDHYEAPGTPLTPYTDYDLVHEQPFQLALLRIYDAQNVLLATTEIVAPVSNEMMCANCHTVPGERVEVSILRRHDDDNGTHLLAERPVLCARCHGSNALGMPGDPELASLSEAMHEHHDFIGNDCYQCHPGPSTQCLRDVMSQRHGMTCEDCHGTMRDVAQTIDKGRRPWFDEPRCGSCHGANYSEPPGTLYRHANNGHGGLYCSACHSSPHAILPSREERDNRQNVTLQGYAGTLRACDVCHGYLPTGPGPHGLTATGIRDETAPVAAARLTAAPNPLVERTEIEYRVVDGSSPVDLAVFDVTGRRVRSLTTHVQTPGDHTLVWDGRNESGGQVAPGVYFCRLETGGKTAVVRLVKLN